MHCNQNRFSIQFHRSVRFPQNSSGEPTKKTQSEHVTQQNNDDRNNHHQHGKGSNSVTCEGSSSLGTSTEMVETADPPMVQTAADPNPDCGESGSQAEELHYSYNVEKDYTHILKVCYYSSFFFC